VPNLNNKHCFLLVKNNLKVAGSNPLFPTNKNPEIREKWSKNRVSVAALLQKV